MNFGRHKSVSIKTRCYQFKPTAKRKTSNKKKRNNNNTRNNQLEFSCVTLFVDHHIEK